MSERADVVASRLERPHSKKCFAVGQRKAGYPWCYVPGYKDVPAVVQRDRQGARRSTNHSFLVLVCLDPTCGAQLLVSERALADLAAGLNGDRKPTP